MTNTRRLGELRVIVVGAALVVLAVVAVTGLFVLAARRLDIDFSDLSRDPASIVGAPPYTGWYANITIVVWTAAAAVALFAALVMRRADRGRGRMFLVVGIISAVMVGDDFFQGHEILQYNLGVPGVAVFAAYTLAAVGWAWWFRATLGAHVLTVLAAMGCWGVSAAIDTVLDESAPYAIEDGAKLAGVALWTFLIVRIALIAIGDLTPGVHIPVQRSAQARHRGPGANPSADGLAPAGLGPPTGPVPVEVRRPAETPARLDPEATRPVRHVPPRPAPPPPAPARPLPAAHPSRSPSPPVLRPRPAPPRRPGPVPPHGARPEPGPRPGWSPPRIVHDVRGPATPPPVGRPGPMHHRTDARPHHPH